MKLKEDRVKFKKIADSGSRQYWYEYVYNVEELTIYTDFSAEHYMKLKGIVNTAQFIRYLCLASLIGVIIFTAYVWHPVNLLIYFTNWVLLIQTFSIWESIKAADDVEFHKDLNALAKHHLLYSFAILGNFIVVVVYWSVIHS